MTEPERQQRSATRIGAALRKALGSPRGFATAVQVVAGCVTKRGRDRFRQAFAAPAPVTGAASAIATADVDYADWIRARVDRRGPAFPLPDSTAGQFSFLTTVYDTAPAYLQHLHESLRRQTVRDFEWVLLDNGSSDAATLAAVAAIRTDARVRYLHVEQNLGIVGGIRRCLEVAAGDYVLPLDSDDLLTPDALQIFAAAIATASERPKLLFSDEDKVRDDEVPFEAYHKPAWDPVLFWNSCYIAHLCCIHRETALALGVYSDTGANGCHDWDTFFRFMRAGHVPQHIDEVLYSWRIHDRSCAGNIDSKSYIHASHRHVLGSNLAAGPRPERFELAASPLFDGTPDWWVRRRRDVPTPPMAALRVRCSRDAAQPRFLTDAGFDDIRSISANDFAIHFAESLRSLDLDLDDPDASIAIVSDALEATGDATEWRWDALAILERFPDTAVVGGRILAPNGTIWSAGEVVGFDGCLLGSPDRRRAAHDPGYFAWLRKQRTVSAVSPLLCVVRARLLADLANARPACSFHGLGHWLAGAAHQRRQRVVFTPMLEARLSDTAASPPVSDPEREQLRAHFGEFFDAPDEFYSRHLSRQRERPYVVSAAAPFPPRKPRPSSAAL